MIYGNFVRRFWIAGLALFVPALMACSTGFPSKGFVDPRLMSAYIPLSQSYDVIFSRWGAALTIAPNIAVTNDHNLNIIPPERLLARSRDYDLLFFRTDSPVAPLTAEPRVGDTVIAYGQGSTHDLREAAGQVVALDEYVEPRCPDCPAQRALVFSADAGGGFSGGPVVDAKTGAVLGVTFGYLDSRNGRRMYAYDIDLVMAEMHRLLDTAAMRPSP
jgi:hypothetical protein